MPHALLGDTIMSIRRHACRREIVSFHEWPETMDTVYPHVSMMLHHLHETSFPMTEVCTLYIPPLYVVFRHLVAQIARLMCTCVRAPCLDLADCSYHVEECYYSLALCLYR